MKRFAVLKRRSVIGLLLLLATTFSYLYWPAFPRTPAMDSDTTKSVEPAASLKLLTFNVGLFEFALAGFPIIKPADFIDLRRAQLPA